MGVSGRMPIRNCRNNNRVGAFNNAPLGRIRFDVGFCCILYIYICLYEHKLNLVLYSLYVLEISSLCTYVYSYKVYVYLRLLLYYYNYY